MHRSLSCLMTVAALVVISTTRAGAQPGHNDTGGSRAILSIAHMNFDCHPDTVIGTADGEGRYLPQAIHWGKATGNDGDSCDGDMPEHLKVTSTTFHYPAWNHMAGSVAFERLNADTLTDIVLYIRGETGEGDARRDTMRPIVIFGQEGLSTIRQLNINAIGRFQAEPYFAMELGIGEELVRPGVRDLSGITSFELQRIRLDVRGGDTAGMPAPSPVAGIEEKIVAHLFPNPAVSSTSLEIGAVAPGEYSVEVVAVNGRVELRQEITIGRSGNLLRTFDVSLLPSGYYLLRLHRAERLVGSYPIIITR